MNTFFAAALTSLFANNLVALGYGIKEGKDFSAKPAKGSWVLLVFFFLEAVVLALVSYTLAPYCQEGLMKSMTTLIFVALMVLLCALFLLFSRFFPAEIQQTVKDSLLELGLNSALMAVAVVFLTLKRSSPALLFGTLLFLPVGYLLSTYVLKALMERIELSDAPKGFKGMPLLLLTLSGLALAVTMLSF